MSGKIVLFIVFGLLLNESNSYAKQERMLSIEDNSALVRYHILLPKDTFLLYEPVIAEFWVRNLSDTTIDWRRSALVGWAIKDEKGQLYPPHVSITPGLTAIGPGDSSGGRIGFILYAVSVGSYPPFFPEGRYTLSYWCFGDSISPLTFSIVKPKGDEARVLDLYLSSFPQVNEAIYKLPRQKFNEYSKKLLTGLLLLADKYPKSTYAPVSLYMAADVAWSALDDKDSAFSLSRRIINDYSDPNGSALGLMHSYYKSGKNAVGFRKDLEKIIESGTDPILVMRARRTLKGLDKGVW